MGGLAASFILGLLLLSTVVRDTMRQASQPVHSGAFGDELLAEDPLDTIGREELRRFASMQEQRVSDRLTKRTSLAAQFRLMGLRPELTPETKELRPVNLAATQTAASQRGNEAFNAAFSGDMRKATPMPEFQILRMEPAAVDPAARWPGGFQSSLVGFGR